MKKQQQIIIIKKILDYLAFASGPRKFSNFHKKITRCKAGTDYLKVGVEGKAGFSISLFLWSRSDPSEPRLTSFPRLNDNFFTRSCKSGTLNFMYQVRGKINRHRYKRKYKQINCNNCTYIYCEIRVKLYKCDLRTYRMMRGMKISAIETTPASKNNCNLAGFG